MASRREKQKKIVDLFRKFDTDGSGRISMLELQKILEALGQGITPDELGKVMREVDTNGDGEIDVNEFIAWTSKGTKLVGTGDSPMVKKLAETGTVEDDTIPWMSCMSLSYQGKGRTWNTRSGKLIDSICHSTLSLAHRSETTPDNHNAHDATPPPKRQNQLEEVGQNVIQTETESSKEPHDTHMTCFDVSWESRQIMTASADHTLKLWDFSGHVVRTFEGSRSAVLCVVVDWLNNRFITGDLSGQVAVWRLDMTTMDQPFESGNAVNIATSCLAVNWGMGRALCGSGKGLQLWDVTQRSRVYGKPVTQNLMVLNGHRDLVTAVLVDWDEMIAVSGSFDMSICRWDLKEGTVLQTISRAGQLSCMTKNGRLAESVITGDRQGKIKIWDLVAGTCQKEISAHEDGILTISEVEGGHVTSGSQEGTVCIHTLDGKCKQKICIDNSTAGIWVVGLSMQPAGFKEKSSAGSS